MIAAPLRVLTVLVGAGTAAYADARSGSDALFGTQLPGSPADVVVVDNLMPAGIHERSAGTRGDRGR